MSSAIEESTPHRLVRSNPPHSPAFHHASRKSATLRLCPVSLWASTTKRLSAVLSPDTITFATLVGVMEFMRRHPGRGRYLQSQKTALHGSNRLRRSVR